MALPDGTVSVDTAAEIWPNHVLTVTVDAEDDYGLALDHLTLSGALRDSVDTALSGTQRSRATGFQWRQLPAVRLSSSASFMIASASNPPCHRRVSPCWPTRLPR